MFHKSVLPQEVIHYISPKDSGVYVDATLGGGGHTRAILEANATCKVIAFDWDTHALELNGVPLQEEFPGRLTLLWANFAVLDQKLKKEGIKKVDGIIADFGTSQYQLLQRPGFSFATDTLLDMRMSPAHQKVRAMDVINQADHKTLVTIFKEYGQEPRSRSIAKKIIEERSKKYIKTTKQLAEIVTSIIPGKKRGIHPATQIFQALRIYVNRELENIRAFLKNSLPLLNPGARLVCISFHSLEDRIVKEFFKEHSTGPDAPFKLLTPKVVIPTPEEIKENPSSRSAKLRAVERKI